MSHVVQTSPRATNAVRVWETIAAPVRRIARDHRNRDSVLPAHPVRTRGRINTAAMERSAGFPVRPVRFSRPLGPAGPRENTARPAAWAMSTTPEIAAPRAVASTSRSLSFAVVVAIHRAPAIQMAVWRDAVRAIRGLALHNADAAWMSGRASSTVASADQRNARRPRRSWPATLMPGTRSKTMRARTSLGVRNGLAAPGSTTICTSRKPTARVKTRRRTSGRDRRSFDSLVSCHLRILPQLRARVAGLVRDDSI